MNMKYISSRFAFGLSMVFLCSFSQVEIALSSHSRRSENSEFGNRAIINLADTPEVTITNDGPTIRGANTTYYATLSHTTLGTKYTCSWSEWKCGRLLPFWKPVTTTTNTCNISSQYDCLQDVGNHTMFLVLLQDDPVKEIADASSVVEVTESINAKFQAIQELTTCNTSSKCLLATKKSIQMTVDLHDPSSFFKGASITYSWSFGDGTPTYVGLEPNVFHNYSSTGLYTVNVDMTATLPDDKSTEKYGSVAYPIQLLDSISNLTIKGASDTFTGSSAQYNVSCNGSVPVSFCWSMIHDSQDNASYIDNNTCIWTLSSQSCQASITYTFNSTGTYHLRVKAVNDVSQLISESNHIDVKIAHIAEYASIAVALVFGIILSLVSIAVVVNSYRKQRMRHVEVANFDFQGDDRHDSFSNFRRRLRDMVTPPPSRREERMKLLDKKQVASELDVL